MTKNFVGRLMGSSDGQSIRVILESVPNVLNWDSVG